MAVSPTNSEVLAVPVQAGTLVYNGVTQTPTWANYHTDQLTIGGTYQNQTNANTYTATFTPKGNYTWSDGSASAKSVSWVIKPAAQSFVLTPSATQTLTQLAPTQTIHISQRVGAGAITVATSNANVVKAEYDGEEDHIVISAAGAGTATITVSAAAATNFVAATKTLVVAVPSFFDRVLANNTPHQIQMAVTAGIAPNLWNVGDKTATITLNGQVGARTTANGNAFNNYKNACAYILGFNHNKEMETEGKDSITFCLGMGSSEDTTPAAIQGKQIAFVDNELYVSVA